MSFLTIRLRRSIDHDFCLAIIISIFFSVQSCTDEKSMNLRFRVQEDPKPASMAPASERELAVSIKSGVAVEISTKNISFGSDQFKKILISLPKDVSSKDFSLSLSEGEDFTFLTDPADFGLESLGKSGPTLILESDQKSFAVPFSVSMPATIPAVIPLLQEPRYGLLFHYKIGADYFFEILSGSAIKVSKGVLSTSIDRPGILVPIQISGALSPHKISTLLTFEMVRYPQKNETPITEVATGLAWSQPSLTSAATLTATWTPATSADKTQQTLQYYTDESCGTQGLVVSTAASATSDSSISSDGSYTFKVTTLDAAGNSTVSACSPAITRDATPPGNPSSVSVPALARTDFSVNFIAGAEQQTIVFHVMACSSSACTLPACVGTNSGSSSPLLLSANSLTSGTSYYACVRAVDTAGNSSQVIASPTPVLFDATAPSGTITLLGSSVGYSNSTQAPTITLTADADTAEYQLCSNTATVGNACTGILRAWAVYAASPAAYNFGSDGSKTLYVQFKDNAGNIGATVASNTVTVDTTAPVAPSLLGFGSSYSVATTLSLAFAVGTDANFSTHDTRLCTASDCTTGCGSTIQSTTSPVSLTGTAGTSYYGCVRSLDLAGNSSSWVASLGTMTIDSTNPTAPSVITVPAYSGSSVNVTYTAGTDTNFSTHNVKACTSNECSTGCLSVTQDLASPVTVSSLVNGSSYWICLQSVDLANNTSAYVASSSSVLIDTSAPTAPSAITWSSAYSNSTTAALTWTNGGDTNFSTHNLKACTDSGCSTSCTSVTQDAATPGSISGMTAGTAYYACLQAVDLVGNTSAFVASAATVTIDTTVPGDPTAVSVPVASNGNVAISFTAGAETNPSSFNIKACTSGCEVGCVGDTTTAGSPGIMSGAALTNGNSYRGCVQGTDLAGNSSNWVPSSGLVIFDNLAPNGASNMSVPAYSNSTSVAASFTVGADANMSTHNFKACTSNDCSTGCLTTIQTATSPATLTSLVNGTAYYACGQAVDLAGNTSSFSFTPATVIIDTTAPTAPASVSVPGSTNGSFNITFSVGTDTNFSTHNVKACTSNDCSTGCVGSGTSAGSPATISGAALTASTSYYGCVQSLDLATNTSAFVASSSTVTIDSPHTVNYNGNGNTGGSVPIDSNVYATGSTVTALGNTGSLTRTNQTFSGWNTAADGSGTTYTAAQTFTISANTTLYAVWSMCTGMAGGTWIKVPGNSIYGTSDFCVQKYAPSDVSSVATSQTGTTPWINISQTTAISECAELGTGYHLITNPEWMTIGANMANVASNWSNNAVGNGTLRRGHSDNSPGSECQADAIDANGYVETNCTGSNTGTFAERRTSTLSNGNVIWDFGGNVWQWVNYNNSADKPNPQNAWVEYPSITGSTATPKFHLVPLNSAQSWWTDSWNSTQGIGKIYPGTNGSGGALVRGAPWNDTAPAGPFAAALLWVPSDAGTTFGFRCAWQPAVTVTYNSNGATSGSVPTDSTAYSSGQGVTILGNTGTLAKTNYTFAGWNTAANGSGTTYTAAQVMTMPAASTTLYAAWSLCGAAGNGCYNNAAAIDLGTAITPLGKSLEYVYANGSSGFKVWKEVGGTRILRANGLDEWTKALNANGIGQSGIDFTDANIGTANTLIEGRVCPGNVYVDASNKFTTTNCLYYTPSYAAQTLNAAGTTDGILGMGYWTGHGWYKGNIQTCSSKRMRLPTIYETTSNQPSSYKPTSDGTPTVWGGVNGVPSSVETWTASTSTLNNGQYWKWSGTAFGYNIFSTSYAVRCVVP